MKYTDFPHFFLGNRTAPGNPLPVRAAAGVRLAAASGRRLALFTACMVLLAAIFAAPFPVAAARTKSAATVEKQYKKAQNYYTLLRKSSRRAKYRHSWTDGIRKFRAIYAAHPKHDRAPFCLLMMARMYRGLYHWSGKQQDLEEAISGYEDLVAIFENHRLADDALYAMAMIYLKDKKEPHNAAKTFARIIALYPRGDMAVAASKELMKLKAAGKSIPAKGKTSALSRIARSRHLKAASAAGTRKADLKPLKYWSNNDYTRVVIETSKPVAFKENLLKKTSRHPRRLYVDLDNCRMPSGFPKSIPIQDGFLKRIRSAQYSKDSVRVVLDTSSFSEYKIFSLNEPFRVVIDIIGQDEKPQVKVAAVAQPKTTAPSLAQQLGLGIQRIVLDPGHGGKDPGAIGPNGLKEKDVVLKVARIVGDKIKKRLGCEVVYTRKRDVYVPLEDRTGIANASAKKCDLFISIHANAAPSPRARGVETYILDLATNNDAMRVAARENATSARKLSDLQTILADLMRNTKVNESVKLAGYVQESMVSGLRKRYGKVNNLGVKRAPFVVLIGARMPAILAEISFISNPTEARRLKSRAYLENIADQIVNGISLYVTELNLANLQMN